jgi:hypothetical protein
MRMYLAILLAIVLGSASRASTNDQATPAGTESLGGRLLDDLSPQPARPATTRQPVPTQRSTKEIEDSLKASTPLNGFGVGQNPATQPLVRVVQGMQQAQTLLAAPGTKGSKPSNAQATPVQAQVLADLDKLIAELSKQCQCSGGNCKNGDSQNCDKPPKPGETPQAKSDKPASAAATGKSPGRDSTDRLDRTSTKPVEKGEVDRLVKALWGNLPERSRAQMLQSFSDEFLPKYEAEIEQYYRRLSEEQGQNVSK